MEAVAGLDDEPASARLGVSREWVRQRRAGESIERLYGPTRKKLRAALDGYEPAAIRGAIVREPEIPLAGDEHPPAPTFVEHVLFTAGRIAELANQIAAAAAQQQKVSYDLGRRAEGEGKRLSVAEAMAQDDEAREILLKAAKKSAGARRKGRS